jgi:hypothetical protein
MEVNEFYWSSMGCHVRPVNQQAARPKDAQLNPTELVANRTSAFFQEFCQSKEDLMGVKNYDGE